MGERRRGGEGGAGEGVSSRGMVDRLLKRRKPLVASPPPSRKYCLYIYYQCLDTPSEVFLNGCIPLIFAARVVTCCCLF